MKKSSGSIAALTAAIITKSVIQNIGIQNIPLSIQVSALIFGPLILGIVTFITTKRIQKHFMIFLILFNIYGIAFALMLIFENSHPEYVKIFRTPFIVITILMFLVMFIVLLTGLADKDKKK